MNLPTWLDPSVGLVISGALTIIGGLLLCRHVNKDHEK